MKKLFYLLLALFLSGILLYGCGENVNTIPIPTPQGNAKIEGIVSDSERGSPLSSTLVTIKETGQKTTTNSEGNFSISLPGGTYTVILTKEGYGESKAQSVKVASGAAATVDMIEMPLINPSWGKTSPTIDISGISDGEVIDITKNIRVNVQGDNDIKLIKFNLGNKYAIPYMSVRDQSSLTASLNPSLIPPDGTYINIYACDENNNISEITMALKGSSSGMAPPSKAPDSVYAQSYTFGEAPGKGKGKAILPGGKLIELSAIPPGASCFVVVNWNGVEEAYGYKISRATGQTGPFSPAGIIAPGKPEQKEYNFIDWDPAFTKPGQTLYYQITPYNSGGTGPTSSTTPQLTILDVFKVNLFSPDNDLVSTVPALSWSYNNPVGEKREYDVYILEQNGNDVKTWKTTITNNGSSETSVTVPAGKLEVNTVYQWDVDAMAFGSNSEYGYLASSSPRLDMIGANNGRFTFTTRP